LFGAVLIFAQHEINLFGAMSFFAQHKINLFGAVSFFTQHKINFFGAVLVLIMPFQRIFYPPLVLFVLGFVPSINIQKTMVYGS
jgi:hypothetical protein